MKGDKKTSMEGIIDAMGMTKTQKAGAKMFLDEIQNQSQLSEISKSGNTTVLGEGMVDEDIYRIISYLQEYFTCFTIMGYDMGGNKISEQYTPTDLSYDVMGKLMTDEVQAWVQKEMFFRKISNMINISMENPEDMDEWEDDDD